MSKLGEQFNRIYRVDHLYDMILKISDVIITFFFFEKYGIGCSMFLCSVIVVPTYLMMVVFAKLESYQFSTT